MSFPQVPRQVIVVLFYAVPVLLLLAMNLQPKSHRVDYSIYTEFYQQSDAKIKAINDTMLWFISNGIQIHYVHEPALEKALLADSIVQRLFNKTEQLKNYLAAESNKIQTNKFSWIIDQKDRAVIEDYFFRKHVADSLQAAIDKAFDSLLNTLYKRDAEIFRNVINYNWFSKSTEALRFWGPIDGGYKANENWCRQIFKDENINSAMALLSMIQNKSLVTESIFLDRIYKEYHCHCGMVFDTIGAIAMPEQALILNNRPFKCLAVIGTFIPRGGHPTFKAETGKVTIQPYGPVPFGIWSGKVHGLGTGKVEGTETIETMDGPKVYPWSFSYFVAAPGVTLELDSMKILYRGIANPVSITVPGYPLSKISLRVPGAKVNKIADGRYELTVTDKAAKKLTAYTDATNNKGRTSTVNIVELKVKLPPPPECLINGVKNDTLSLNIFNTHAELNIQAPDSDFAASYDLVKYSATLLKTSKQCIGPIECNNPKLAANEQLAELLKQAESGDRIYITDVIVNSGGSKNMEAMPVTVVLR